MNHSNNAFSVLNGSITNVATTITVATGTGSRFPSSNFMVTLIGYDGLGNENAWEICLCSSRTGDVLTVVRGRESTTAVAWANATRIENRITAGTMGNLLYLDKGGTVTAPVTLMYGAYTAFKVGLTGLVSVGGEAGSADSRFTITNGGAEGLEFSQTAIAGQNRILSYNRLGAAFVPLSLSASEVRFNISGTDTLTANASGLTYAGTLTGGTGAINIGSGQIVKDTSGNVGIGVTPLARLHTLTSNAGTPQTTGTGTTGVSARFGNESINFDIGTYASGSCFIQPRLVGDNSSNFGLVLNPNGGVVNFGPGGAVSLGGAIGYGAGAGTSATQAVSKSETVTLATPKPSGRITMHNAALAAGASVSFTVVNSFATIDSPVIVSGAFVAVNPSSYRIECTRVLSGQFDVRVTNITAGSLSEALAIHFNIIKGSTA